MLLSSWFLIGCFTTLSANLLKHDDRVYGGFDLDIKEVPYLVEIIYLGHHTCGGSIIAANWVLTAAHCMYFRFRRWFSILAGATYQRQVNGPEGSLHFITKFIVHKKFNLFTLNCDFALIKVDEPFPIGKPGYAIVKLCHEEPLEGSLLVSGWGKWDSGRSSDHIRGVHVEIRPRNQCSRSYWRIHYFQSMICAVADGKGASKGDSGGPLVDKSGNLCGVVSWAKGGVPNSKRPGVYANVANQLAWMRKKTGLDL